MRHMHENKQKNRSRLLEVNDSKPVEIEKDERLELRVKSNGHNICTKTLKNNKSLLREMSYYLSQFKLPINFNIRQMKPNLQSSTLFASKDKNSGYSQRQEGHQFQKLSQQLGSSMQLKTDYKMEDELHKQTDYDIHMLAQQIQLFDCEEQMDNYIENEKLFAHDVEQKLTKLSKTLILINNSNYKKTKLEEEFEKFAEMDKKMQDGDVKVTKQKLNEIENNCMKILTRVQEERKRMEMCVICWEKESTVIMIPCMHLVMCENCPLLQKCPVCKTQINAGKKIFR